MAGRKYDVTSREPQAAPRPVERGLKDAELAEEIARAEQGEGDPAFREEWLGRLYAEQELRRREDARRASDGN